MSVHHSYQPIVGASVGAGFFAGDTGGERGEVHRRRYCIDDAFERAALSRIAEPEQRMPPFIEKRVSYILRTASNWGGPIGTFRLTVDKGSADALVSFCGDDIVRVGPTRFEMTKHDFVPVRDLDVLFLEPLSP